MLPALSKSSHVFRMGNLVHNNIVQTYLADNCESKKLRLCKYINELPNSFDAFVWNEASPLNKDTKAHGNIIQKHLFRIIFIFIINR
jgi:hypothetical protein